MFLRYFLKRRFSGCSVTRNTKTLSYNNITYYIMLSVFMCEKQNSVFIVKIQDLLKK